MIVGFSLLLAIMEVVRAQMEEMPGAGIGSGHKLRFSALLKFIYSEKATKFCEIFTLLLTVCKYCSQK